mmetsp:Transcript_25589/g.36048  ORF Transcript_25589/g.36048 Transcript_25589/m.36048 type:complete len:267 (+) Transcript_25589:276-1076(+)
MTFRGKGTVTDLGSLEGNNHVGSRTQHCQVTSNSGRERNLEPIIWCGIWESSSKHLAHRNIGGNVGKDSNNSGEPVNTGTFSHLCSTAAHGAIEECLGNTSIIKGTNQKELSNEKHQKTVIDFSQSGLGLSDKFFFFRLDLVTIHVVSLLGGERVAFGIVLSVIGTGIVVLTLVGSDNHKDSTGADRYNTYIKTNTEANQEHNNNENLDLRPDRPSSTGFFLTSFLGSSLTGIVGVLLGKHFRCAVSGKHNSNVFHKSRGTGEEFC